MEDIYAEIPIANEIAPQLRQASGSELNWVSIAPVSGASDVVIDATALALEAGEYEITLESYDSSSPVGSTLKTDKIVVKIEANPSSDVPSSDVPSSDAPSSNAPSFDSPLDFVILTPGEPKEWKLPKIDAGTHELVSVKVKLPSSLANFLEFDKETQTITF